MAVTMGAVVSVKKEIPIVNFEVKDYVTTEKN